MTSGGARVRAGLPSVKDHVSHGHGVEKRKLRATRPFPGRRGRATVRTAVKGEKRFHSIHALTDVPGRVGEPPSAHRGSGSPRRRHSGQSGRRAEPQGPEGKATGNIMTSAEPVHEGELTGGARPRAVRQAIYRRGLAKPSGRHTRQVCGTALGWGDPICTLRLQAARLLTAPELLGTRGHGWWKKEGVRLPGSREGGERGEHVAPQAGTPERGPRSTLEMLQLSYAKNILRHYSNVPPNVLEARECNGGMQRCQGISRSI